MVLGEGVELDQYRVGGAVTSTGLASRLSLARSAAEGFDLVEQDDGRPTHRRLGRSTRENNW